MFSLTIFISSVICQSIFIINIIIIIIIIIVVVFSSYYCFSYYYYCYFCYCSYDGISNCSDGTKVLCLVEEKNDVSSTPQTDGLRQNKVKEERKEKNDLFLSLSEIYSKRDSILQGLSIVI